VVLVPGGPGEEALRTDDHMLEWLRAAHEASRWTTSVCTGALTLAAAGLLGGIEATTHWRAMDDLARLGAVPVTERWVQRVRIITAAGVSAGIDMALHLLALEAGPERASRPGHPRVRPPAAVQRRIAGEAPPAIPAALRARLA